MKSTKPENSSDFDSTNLIMFLYHWRKPLIIVTVVAVIASSIFSSPFFIKPKFKSTVILFPTAGISISKALLSENPGSKKDISQFGEEEEAEQMLQILNADEIKQKIIEKYDLMKHYDIDPDSKYPWTELYDELEANISFKKTEFMSIEIKVLDTDPDTAALIANDIANLLDTVKNRMQKELAIKAFKIVEENYNNLRNYIKTLEDSLKVLGSLGVYDYKTQSEVLNREYAQAIARNNKTAIKALENKLDILAKYGSTQMSLAFNLEYTTEQQLSHIKLKYEEAKADASQNLPHKFIVNHAFPAEKKSYPIRWLIVVISTLSSILLCVLVIIGIENVKRMKVLGINE